MRRRERAPEISKRETLSKREYEELKRIEPRIIAPFEELKEILALPNVREKNWTFSDLKKVLRAIQTKEKEILERTKKVPKIERIEVMADPEEGSWEYIFFEYKKEKGKLPHFSEKPLTEIKVIPRTIAINLSPSAEELSPSHPNFKKNISQSAGHELLHNIVDYPLTSTTENGVKFIKAIQESLENKNHPSLKGWEFDFSPYKEFLKIDEFLESLFLNICEIATCKLEDILWKAKKRAVERGILKYAEAHHKALTEELDPLSAKVGILNFSQTKLGKEFEEIALLVLPVLAFREAIATKRGYSRKIRELSHNDAEEICGILGNIRLFRAYEKLVSDFKELYERIEFKE